MIQENITKTKIISLVAPMYNEQDVLGVFFSEIEKIFADLHEDYEIICVNDGSSDGTFDILKKFSSTNNRIKVVNLSRNFGKEIALTAGLDFASGDAVIPIDCDLQDPPNVIVEMLEKWKSGFQVVLAKRTDRKVDSYLKRTTSSIFYKIIGKISDVDIPQNVGDFRLLDRIALEAIKKYPERSRFMKGLLASIGFKQTTIEYTRAERLAGETKWNYWKLYKLALEGFISFTSLPLKIWSYIGATIAFCSFFFGIYLIVKTVIFGIDTPGYASLMVVLLFMSSLILICLGVLGEYLSRIFIEVKQRPIYIVSDLIGLDDK